MIGEILLFKMTKSDLIRLNAQILAPQVILIKPPSKLFTSNTLVFDEEVKLVVDAGFQHGTGLLETTRDFFNIGENDLLFLSHMHLDHVIGAHLFADSTKIIHTSEKNALKNEKSFIKFYYQSQLALSEFNKWKNRFSSFLNYEGLSEWADLSLENIQSINSNTVLNLGEKNLEILHLPGHSPGHCGLYDLDSQLLFIADIDLRRFGPWYGWKSSNLQSFRKTITFLQDFIETNQISLVIPSHSKPIDKYECLKRLIDFYEVFEERKRKILDFIRKRKGTTIEELVRQSFIYQRWSDDFHPRFVNEIFERFHIEHHLEELEREKYISYMDNQIVPLT